MNNAGDGDRLARGQKSATFQGGFGDGELKPNIAPEEESVPALVDNSALFAPTKPAVFYRGTPFNKRILVVPMEVKSNSRLIIPDSAKAQSDLGRVKAFSNDSELRQQGLKVGDLVMFDKFAATGKNFPLLNEAGESEQTLLLQECDVELLVEEVRNEELNPEPSVQ